MQGLRIERSCVKDCSRLTEIAFAAKRHWGYPEAYFLVWEKELTITPEYIAQNTVFSAHYNSQLIGFYSLIWTSTDVVLDHIFLDPMFLQRGIGSQMISHAKNVIRGGADSVLIFVDPHATGFYDRIGATHVDTVASNIEGRVIPVYRLELKGL